MALQHLVDLDLSTLVDRPFHPSPAAWEDQALYFLMLDRFSDGSEAKFRANDGTEVLGGTTPLFGPADAGNAVRTPDDALAWRDAGGASPVARSAGWRASWATWRG